MNSFPIDLIEEILSRLPAKSIERFRCVSKLWYSMLHRPYFTELFLTRSSARPRLLFAFRGLGDNEWFFFSSPHPHSDKSSSLVVTADFQLKLPEDMRLHFCGRASGLFCFTSTSISKKNAEDSVHVICNPSTRKYGFLPKLRTSFKSFLGFDPIDKIFKVLSMAYYQSCADGPNILTLGTGEMMWRKIQCPLTHYVFANEICINGVLYYWGRKSDEVSYVIVCFEVRSEKFKFIQTGVTDFSDTRFINYMGTLGVISWHHRYTSFGARGTVELWLPKDVEKQKWSKQAYAYTFSDNCLSYGDFFVAGVTITGEIIFSTRYSYSYKPFYVFYINPERDTLQRVEIQGSHQVFGISSNQRVYTFVDHVEDLTFNMEAQPQQDRGTFVRKKEKQYRGTFESSNKFDALCLLDDV